MQVVTTKALMNAGKVIPAGTIVDLDADVIRELGASVEPVGKREPKNSTKGKKTQEEEPVPSGEEENPISEAPPEDEPTNETQE